MSIADKLTTIADNQQAVFDAGKKAEYDRFWDAYQQNGNRVRYRMAFAGPAWAGAGLLPPKYPIALEAGVTTQEGMFSSFNAWGKSRYDMAEVCKKIDFSTVTYATRIFHSAMCENITCDFSSAVSLEQTFSLGNGGNIDNVTLKVTDKVTSFGQTFAYCSTICTLTFTEDSVIAANLSLSDCINLTHDSLMSVINALKNLSGTGTTKTLTLGTANLAKLTDAEKAIATQKGWTLA